MFNVMVFRRSPYWEKLESVTGLCNEHLQGFVTALALRTAKLSVDGRTLSTADFTRLLDKFLVQQEVDGANVNCEEARQRWEATVEKVRNVLWEEFPHLRPE